MKLTRREFSKTVPLGLILVSTGGMIELEGCAGLSVYLGLALTGFTSLVNLLVSKGLISASNAIVVDVYAAFAAAQAADNTYNSDKTAGASALVSALSAVNQALQTFLAQADIPVLSGLVSLVLDAVQVIISTIAGYLGGLPNPAPSPSTLKAKVGQSVAVVPKKRSPRVFRDDWNKVVTGYPTLKLNG
ncbi:MAG: hypothetical protein WA766_07550 [Candidatus Acidiferrales bacterium]